MIRFKFFNALTIALILMQAVMPIPALAMASTSTDQSDYTPGSTVTIAGDNGAGFVGGEDVHVDVSGPGGFSAACDATAGEEGAWSCQVTLPSDAAEGSYDYAAAGVDSGATQSGSFTVTAPPPLPTEEPTQAPTLEPTQAPTLEPAATSTPEATQAPIEEPTSQPTAEPTQAPAPFIQSDKDDYAPSELVTLSGGNWQGDRQVRIFVNDNVGQTWSRDVVIEDSSDCTVVEQINKPNWFVATYVVSASGQQTGRVVTTSFTDARVVTTATINGGTSVSVAPGASITAVVNVTTDGSGSNARWRSTGWKIATSLPTAGTYICENHANHDGAGAYSKTFGINAPTIAGTYNAYFTAYNDDTCGGGVSNVFILTNGVTVNPGLLAGFTVTNTSDGNIGTQTAGMAFNIKVRAVDAFGNTVTSFNGGSNKVSISSTGTLSSGSGATASFTNGVLASHSVTISNTGTFTITATRNAGGSESGTSNPFQVNAPPDNTPPDTSITANPADPANSTSASFSFTGTDNVTSAGSLAFECSLDGGLFGPCTTPRSYTGLANGSHTFRARAKDAANNIDPTPAAFTWVIDTVAPDTTITASPPASSHSSTASFSFIGSDPGGSGVADFACSLDGGAFTACTSPKTYSGLADGNHTFQVRASDLAGNSDASPASYSWMIDATAPETFIDTAPAPLTNSGGATFTFHASESATFACSLDGGAFVSCTSPQGYSGLADGSHTFEVRATDAVGNTDATPASFTWTVDTLAPDTLIDSTPAALSNSSSAAFTFHATETASFACSFDGGPFTACASPQNYSSLADGSHTFEVKATDAAGNTDATPASFAWSIDTVAPDTAIDTHPAALVNSDSASFTFHASESATSACSLDGSAFSACTSPQDYSSLADGSHTFEVKATDAAGNTDATPASFTWTVDTAAPNTTLDSTPALLTNSTTASFTFSADEAASFACSLDGAPYGSCTSPSNYTGLAEGSHTFAVKATDVAGNTDPTPASFTWTIDTTPPVVIASPDRPADHNGWYNHAVTITFSASDAVSCDAPVIYSGPDTASGSVSGTCQDPAGNVGTGTFNLQFDKTAPTASASASPAANANGWNNTNVTVSFSGDDGAGSGIDFCDADVVLSSEGTGQSVSGTCTDVAGNVSAPASKTGINIDKTAPIITGAATTAPNANGWYKEDVTIHWTCSDALSDIDGSCPADSIITGEGDNLSADASVSDLAGNSASVTVSGIKIDRTAPTISGAPDRAANSSGWYNADVTVTFSCEDGLSGLASCSGPSILVEGAGQSVTGSATDLAGNSANSAVTGISIDKTAPSINASRAPDANTFGWNNTDVTASYTASDALSGLASPATGSHDFTAEGAGQSHTFTVSDMAGNLASATIDDVNIDKTAPAITGSPDRAANANNWYNADVTISFDCDDELSGVDVCTAPVTLSEGADQSVLGSVTDKAGNSANTFVNDINIDKTAPIITASLDKSPAVTGWFNATTGAPTVSFTCSDTLSGLDGSCPAPYLFGEGANQAHHQTIYDLAGNSASAVSSNIDVDTVAPSISVALDRSADASGWFNILTGAPVAEFACSDTTSGIETCPDDFTFGEGENLAHFGTAYDQAGNSNSTAVSGVDVDLIAPAVTVTPGRSTDHNGWYNAPVSFSFSATDATSGVNICDADENFNGPDNASASVSGACTDNAGNTGSKSLSFQYDNTDPSVTASVSPAASVTGWWNLSTGAPTVSFACSDVTAGLESCEDPHTFGNGANQSFTGSATDNAGNTQSATVSEIDVDLVAPSVSAALDRSPAASGWFNVSTGAPTVQFTCSDSGSSGLASCPSAFAFGQGANQVHSGTAYDQAGNSATAGVSGVNVDTVAPSISVALDRSPAASGWFNEVTGAPTAHFTCSDATSGIVGCPANYIFSNGENQSHSGTVSDQAGNSASAGVGDVDVDLTDPTITWNGGPANNTSYYFGSVPAAPTCTAVDSLSGPHSCIVSGYSVAVGPHTMTATAKDVAGNTYIQTRTYTVLAWTLNGFYQPVDMNGIYNVVRNGSTVPLKFEIFSGGTELTSTTAVLSLTANVVSCQSGAVEDLIEVTATGNTSLRYDASMGQFIYNWKTPSMAGKCYRVTMTAQDGSTLIAYFKLK